MYKVTRIAFLSGISLLVSVSCVSAIEIWSSDWGDRYYAFDAALKWTTILSHAPKDTVLYPERWSGAGLTRMRFTFRARPASPVNVTIAYEQRIRSVSEGSGSGGGAQILLSEGHIPYRLFQLDEPLVEIGTTFSYRHELDRAFMALSLGRSELTIGRQAIGWGRGVIFEAVDIFAGFSPLESDREWRRGIDAVRGTLPMTDRISLEAVAAAGESLEASAFVGRLYGYGGNIDGELIFGKRYQDHLYAATISSPVGNAEVHGELALYKTPEILPEGGTFGKKDLVTKSVIGGSYSLNLGKGLLLVAEYHYSGFGVGEIEEAGERLRQAAFRERYLRGDMKILGRHACLVRATYGIGGIAPLDVTWIFSPVDWSGVFAPAVTWTFSDNVTFTAYMYLPYGKVPKGGEMRSEYGAVPVSGLVQMGFYF